MDFKTKYCTYTDCSFEVGEYENGNHALSVVDEEGLIMVCSVNPGVRLISNCIAIKDYSENEGVADTLKEMGIIGRKRYEIPSGFVRIPVYELTEKGLSLFADGKTGAK